MPTYTLRRPTLNRTTAHTTNTHMSYIHIIALPCWITRPPGTNCSSTTTAEEVASTPVEAIFQQRRLLFQQRLRQRLAATAAVEFSLAEFKATEAARPILALQTITYHTVLHLPTTTQQPLLPQHTTPTNLLLIHTTYNH